MDTEKKEILEMFQVFSDFSNLCYSNFWPQNSTSEKEINNVFECVKFVENALSKFKEKELLNEYLQSFEKWYDGSTTMINRKVWENPLHNILRKFVSKNLNIDILDSATKQFLASFGEKQLEITLAKILVTSASLKFITRFNLIESNQKYDQNNIEIELILTLLKEKKTFETVIQDIVVTSDTKNLIILIQCITFRNPTNLIIQNKIKHIILEIMSESTNKYEKFWFMILTEVNKVLLLQLCLEDNEIFRVLVGYLIVKGKNMSRHGTVDDWVSSEPDTSSYKLLYTHFVEIVFLLTQRVTLREYFIKTVKLDKNSDVFWKSVLQAAKKIELDVNYSK